MSDEVPTISQRSMYDLAMASLYRVVRSHMSTLLADASRRGDLVQWCANEVSKSSEQKPFTCGELEKLLSTEWERLAGRYARGLRDDMLFAPDEPEEYQSFGCRCPFCGTTGS